MQTKTTPKLKSANQVRKEFEEAGISYAAWAREHKTSRVLVYQVLAGVKKGLRGESHRVAVLLGLKNGRLGVQARDMASHGLKGASA